MQETSEQPLEWAANQPVPKEEMKDVRHAPELEQEEVKQRPTQPHAVLEEQFGMGIGGADSDDDSAVSEDMSSSSEGE